MVFLRTSDYGRVTLRHNRPADLSDEQKSAGVLVESVPERPAPEQELYVVNGSPVWKPRSYRFEAQGDLEGLRSYLLQEVKQKREEVETRGVDYSGHAFASDRQSRQSLVETLSYAQDQPSFSTTWKTSGGFMEVTTEDLRAIRDKITELRQAAFERESALATEIRGAATTQELKAVDITSGWP